MNGLIVVLLVLIGLVLIVGLALGIWLIRLRNQVETALAQVRTEMQRRLDMIPNLVKTVKGYAAHESETLEAVISARSAAVSTPATPGTGEGADLISASLGRLMALSERYPDLKADKSFAELQNELAETENRIGFGRKLYNETVLIYNNAQQVFPANLIAARFSHTPSMSFEASPESATPPVVEF
jgi:LemA protein